jgi:hypothetical protein
MVTRLLGVHLESLNAVTIARQLAILTVGIGVLTVGCAGTHVAVGFNAGVQPVCPYGYYEAPPYSCAPDGYYGPEWFNGGVFVGAGPWFHGPERFYGHVDHRLDFRKGYRGPTPARGEAPAAQRAQFHGQAMHDPRGHEAPRGRR